MNNQYFKKNDVYNYLEKFVKGFEPSPDKYDAAVFILNCMYQIPIADVKPVVHGKWMNEEREGFNAFSAECDQCGKRTLSYFHYNYCPNCGADMREYQRTHDKLGNKLMEEDNG